MKTDIAKIFRPVEQQLKQVRQLTNKQMKATCGDDGMKKVISSFSLSSGKMLRPALVLLSGAACGKITQRHIRIASVVEMLHNATLLHDDVIDASLLRRARPTVNSLFGNERAILLGDFLLSRLFSICCGLDNQSREIIAETIRHLAEGELRQTIHKKDYELSEKEYLQIITDKTAALFSACCSLGAALADAGQIQNKSLLRFGLNLGIAFQLADDLFDLTGDENKCTKTLGADADGNKPTLALIHHLSRLSPRQKTKLTAQLDKNSLSRNELRQIIETDGALDYVRKRISKYIEEAVANLGPLKDSDAKNALIETAKFVNELTA